MSRWKMTGCCWMTGTVTGLMLSVIQARARSQLSHGHFGQYVPLIAHPSTPRQGLQRRLHAILELLREGF